MEYTDLTKIIAQKIESYKADRTKLEFLHDVATRLGFVAETNRIEGDLRWIKEILNMLQDMNK